MVESSGLLNRRRVYSSTGGSNPPLSAKVQMYLTDSKSVRRRPFFRSPAVSPTVQALGPPQWPDEVRGTPRTPKAPDDA